MKSSHEGVITLRGICERCRTPQHLIPNISPGESDVVVIEHPDSAGGSCEGGWTTPVAIGNA